MGYFDEYINYLDSTPCRKFAFLARSIFWGRYSFSAFAKHFIYLFYLTLLFACYPILDAHAIRQYKCNDKIQYYPCGMSFPGRKIIEDKNLQQERSLENHNVHIKKSSFKYIPNNKDLVIKDAAFNYVDHKRGKWTGVVNIKDSARSLLACNKRESEDSKKIKLTLYIISAGKIIESRNMGETCPVGDSISYAFVSSVPIKIHDWSWKVVGEVVGGEG